MPRFLPIEAAVPRSLVKKNGFTLLEVMIAVAIIAIAVVTLLGAQSQSVSIVSSAKFDTMASLLAQWKMSDLILQDFEQLTDDEGNFGEDYPQFSWKLTVTELSEGETGLPGTADQIKALDIAVRSIQDNSAEFVLRTLVYNRPLAKESDKTSETPDEQLNRQETSTVPENEARP
ncbi:prepilin-type N-terminal cleavage/methylation domain-containing protein [Desulfobulbus propionicus]|jgi:general secretion pathway protein I